MSADRASSSRPEPRFPLSVAPMVDRTDRHYRWFMRQITARTLLYTPMIATGAILHGARESILAYDPSERPLALQLGGDDPAALAECARIAEDMGYDEVDLNVGCPSSRVASGSFGACLMARPERVAECVAAMRATVKLPVTVKHRVGIESSQTWRREGEDEQCERKAREPERSLRERRYAEMLAFVDRVAEAEPERFIVHARIAVLGGLSPKQNRTIPPLRYDLVHRLARERPALSIEINGGIRTLEGIDAQLEHVDGVMLARAAYDDPFLFATADERYYGAETNPSASRRDVALAMVPYLARWTRQGVKAQAITRHLMGLYAGVPGGRHFRRVLTEVAARGEDIDERTMDEALSRVRDEAVAA